MSFSDFTSSILCSAARSLIFSVNPNLFTQMPFQPTHDAPPAQQQFLLLSNMPSNQQFSYVKTTPSFPYSSQLNSIATCVKFHCPRNVYNVIWLKFTLSRPIILCARYLQRSAIRLIVLVHICQGNYCVKKIFYLHVPVARQRVKMEFELTGLYPSLLTDQP